ncbi:hypothetical protein [Demequina silvatica]|uniref:hypothetical protein n=1 Tax=Demequina silvatica TaxID=1638988 RepID=UPI0007816CB9|nr:hypothetical protein [Demequina silvatica]
MTDVALLLTPIPNRRFLTALCALHKVRGRVLETSGGPIAVLDDATAGSAQHAARALSGFVKGAEFLLAESRDGNVKVELWKAGAMERELPAGLALADAPGVVTTLLTGAQTLDQVAETHEQKVHSTDMGRVKAYRELLKETKALKKAQS